MLARLIVACLVLAVAAHAQCPGASNWAAAVSNSRIRFNAFHPSGVRDNAFASIQSQAAARGQMAQNSRYGNAPGGSVCLNPKIADTLVAIASQGSVVVNEITGGSHSRGSAHYEGRCADIGSFNGRRLDRANRAAAMTVIETCRRFGAYKIFNINLSCGSVCTQHNGWVHCQFNGAGSTSTSTNTNTNSGNDAACANRGGQCKNVNSCSAPSSYTSGLCPSYGASIKCCIPPR